VILIGSGVSANAVSDSGRRPPTWGEFLKIAYKALGRRTPHITSALKRYNYLEACDYLKTALGHEWNAILKDNFVKPQYRAGEIHKAIFDLDSRIVASLNFDKIYETYAVVTSENTVIIKNYHEPDVRQTVAGADRYIIKPHGSVDTISKLIFTLEDYAKARIEYSAFYEIMEALLHTHTFLCIGCGLSDPDMKLMFEDYTYKHGEAPHFMTLPSPVSDEEIRLIRKTRGLNVLRYSSKDRHKELTSALTTLGAKVSETRDLIAKLRSW